MRGETCGGLAADRGRSELSSVTYVAIRSRAWVMLRTGSLIEKFITHPAFETLHKAVRQRFPGAMECKRILCPAHCHRTVLEVSPVPLSGDHTGSPAVADQYRQFPRNTSEPWSRLLLSTGRGAPPQTCVATTRDGSWPKSARTRSRLSLWRSAARPEPSVPYA